MASTLDCRTIAQEYFDWVAAEKKKLKPSPALATLLCRSSAGPASLRYRELILKDAERLGIAAQSLEARGESELVEIIGRLNGDESVSGILVFYPLKTSLDDEDVMDLVSPAKDVEGLHSMNLGYLIKYKRFLDDSHHVKCVVPATAKAVVKTLQRYPKIILEGAFVVIINNSMRVGKPLGLMLENLGATVVKCYDKTPRAVLEDCVRRADVVITAVPDPAFRIELDWIRESAAVVDISFEGNIDAADLNGRASYVTSPDNRIGQVTRAMTFVNLIYCARAGRGG